VREIGIIARENEARVLADYLLTRNITTKIEPKDGVWAVWVHREERVPEARAVLTEFQENPADPRFHAASDSAKEIRKKAEKVERDYQKRTKNLRDRWEGSMYQRAPLAFSLILVSVIVFVLEMFVGGSVYGILSFSYQFIDLEGFQHDTGFEQIRSGQIWRLITPIFLHFGPMHLLFNMIALRYLGEQIEIRKGSWRLALIAIIAAVGGNVGQYFYSGGGFGGMSGVVFALAGYLWIKGHTDPEDGLSMSQQSANWMIAWFLLGIIAPMSVAENMRHGFPFNMANIAHGVGLMTGVIFGLLRF
jgi:GlpG protein